MIDTCIRRCTRYCLNKSKFDSILVDMFGSQNRIDMYDINKTELANLAHQINYKYAPPYFVDFVSFNSVCVRTTRRNTYSSAQPGESPLKKVLIVTWGTISTDIPFKKCLPEAWSRLSFRWRNLLDVMKNMTGLTVIFLIL